MLGHSGCGAVTAAVDCYLRPTEFWSESMPPMLRNITQRIFVAVREADNGIKASWGSNAREMPGFRGALIDTAVCLNAAHAAFDLRKVVASASGNIDVLYGVFSLRNHQVSMPVDPRAAIAPENVNLAQAPANPQEFHDLAYRMAELCKPPGMARLAGIASSGAGARVLQVPAPQPASRPASDPPAREQKPRESNGEGSPRDLIGWEMNSRPL
jgi:carbonic anhydrase